MTCIETIERPTSTQARLRRERLERQRRISARAVEDHGISIVRHTLGVDGYQLKALREEERQRRIDDAKEIVERQKHEQSLEERLSILRQTMIVTYEKPGSFALEPVDTRVFTIADIQRVFCPHAGVTRNDLISGRRTLSITAPRQLCMMLCKALTTDSFPKIGRMFGGRDHTTVMHAIRKMKPIEETVRARLNNNATLLDWVRETLDVYSDFPKHKLKARGQK